VQAGCQRRGGIREVAAGTVPDGYAPGLNPSRPQCAPGNARQSGRGPSRTGRGRTPRRYRAALEQIASARSWSAAVLCRFPRRDQLFSDLSRFASRRLTGSSDPCRSDPGLGTPDLVSWHWPSRAAGSSGASPLLQKLRCSQRKRALDSASSHFSGCRLRDSRCSFTP
jgi:hypothetical protein